MRKMPFAHGLVELTTKMSILLKTIYRLHVIPVNIPKTFFSDLGKSYVKIYIVTLQTYMLRQS